MKALEADPTLAGIGDAWAGSVEVVERAAAVWAALVGRRSGGTECHSAPGPRSTLPLGNSSSGASSRRVSRTIPQIRLGSRAEPGAPRGRLTLY